MDDGYFLWLLRRLGLSDPEDYEYAYLCKIMHNYTFYPLLTQDENRCKDGERYRVYYMEQEGACQPNLGGCTVLELLISLAEKMAYELCESPYESEVRRWFEEMVENLGLTWAVNDTLMENPGGEAAIEDVLEDMIFRRYGRDGFGGLFPVDSGEYDQRRAELMVQMNNYLARYYDIS